MSPSKPDNDAKTDTQTLSVKDIRMLRPIVFLDKKRKLSVVVQQSEIFKVDGCRLEFYTPNNVSLFVSIAHRELGQARKIHLSLLQSAIGKKSKKEIKGRNLTRLYNYFEHVQSSVIAIYTAVESLSNIAIPHDFKLERKNSKGITEVWDKHSIERWYKTSEKLSDILPKVLKIESPKELPVWSKFRCLEDIRNDIIHQKTSTKSETDVDSKFLRKLLEPQIFDTIQAGFAVISYFCNKNTSHAYFPLGFGPAHVEPEEVDDLETFFTKVEDE